MQKLSVKKNLNNSSEVWDVFVDEKFIGAIEKIDDGILFIHMHEG